MSVITIPDEKVDVSEFISPFRYSWKNFLSYGNQIKSVWKKNNFSEEFNKNLFILNNDLYTNLKEYEKCEDSYMRKENKILENQINTDYQKLLFDFLYDQQDLYIDYDQIFKQNSGYINLQLRDQKKFQEKPKIFPQFILNFNNYLSQFKKSSKQLNQLQKIRWYLAFDVLNLKDKDETFSLFKKHFNIFQNFVKPKKEVQNKDPFDFTSSFFETTINENYTDDTQEIILSKELITQFIKGESNELIYVLKLLNLTITFYCQFIMNYLYTTYKEKKYEFIKEYNKRFQNYIYCAMYIDHLCENINVATNYIYEITCPDYPIFPKFSIFRLFMKTWFREMSSNISEFDSFFSFFKLNISGIYSNFLSKDFEHIKQNINIPTKYKSEVEETGINSTIELSTSTKPSVTSNLTSIMNTGVTVSVTCPFGSLYENNSICYSIIELALNSLYDSFVNEYSVYSLNLTTIDTNGIYEDLEDNFADIIESRIRNIFNKLVIEEKIMPNLVIEALIKHFKSTFYSNRILKKLKSTIYNKVYLILSMLLYNEIKVQFCQYVKDSNPKNIKEFKAIGYLEVNVIEPEKKDLVIRLIDECKNDLISDKIKEYLAVKFLTENTKKSDNFLIALQEVTEWYLKEEKKFNNKNKQVNKELVSKNFPTFCDFQKTLLSISDHVPWSKIESIKGMLSKFEPVVTDSYYNINEDLIPSNDDNFDDLQIKPPW